jgi:2-keto-4-pentenoate hydratase
MKPADLIPELLHARLNAQPLVWPASTPPDLAAGYAAQLAIRELRIAGGERPLGYKVGFTNRTIWPRYEVYAPIWGSMWDSSVTDFDPASPAGLPQGEISLAGLCEPRIEPEIVFCLREAPPAGCSLAQLVGSIAWLSHGFEIVHSHFPGWKFTAAQGVADGSLHGRMLIGPRIDLPAGIQAELLVRALSGLQLKLYGDGELKDEGVGQNVLDGPLQALLYFVQEIRSLPGAPLLKAGDIVTTGTLTDAYAVRPGQCWHTELKAFGPLADQLRGLRVDFV